MRTEDKKVIESARECAVAGSFYPSQKVKLTKTLAHLFQNATESTPQNVNALIVPHAGYIFSGAVAASAYKTLHKPYKNVFIIGSSHHVNFDGVSIYTPGDYKTPLGLVKVNTQIVKELLQQPFINFEKDAHTNEHAIEVQLPFLQSIYKDKLQIVPIIIASTHYATLQKLAEVLQPYFNDENLFIFSSDLSHYPSYTDAQRLDRNLLKSLEANDPSMFLKTLQQNENTRTKKLKTSACGWSSLLTLLLLTQDEPYTYELIEYKNSGDTKYGDHESVVGYGAVRIYKEPFTLSDTEKKQLKEIAQLTLYEQLHNNKRITLDTSKLSKNLTQKLGVFVTLNHHNKLRGCIGRFEPNQSLYDTVVDMAIAAANYDTRFTPLKATELADTHIEVSVLTPRVKVNSLEEIELGRDGIYVEFEGKHGTYLPHVATDMNWTKEQFFQSCCQDKAQIAPQDCAKATLYRYEAIVF